jgi:hypothetical protein
MVVGHDEDDVGSLVSEGDFGNEQASQYRGNNELFFH